MTSDEWNECCRACARECELLYHDAYDNAVYYEPWGQNPCSGAWQMWKFRSYGYLLAARAISALGEHGPYMNEEGDK